MINQNGVAVNIKINGLKPVTFIDNHIIQSGLCIRNIVVHNRVQEHPFVTLKLPIGKTGEFCLHFIDFTGGEESHPTQIDSQNWFVVFQAILCCVQNGSVATNGDYNITVCESLILGQITHAGKSFHIGTNCQNYVGTGASQNPHRLCSYRSSTGFCGIGNNKNSHADRSFRRLYGEITNPALRVRRLPPDRPVPPATIKAHPLLFPQTAGTQCSLPAL